MVVLATKPTLLKREGMVGEANPGPSSLFASEPAGNAVAPLLRHGSHLGHQMRCWYAKQIKHVKGWRKGLMKMTKLIGEGEKAPPFGAPNWSEVENIGGVTLLSPDVVIMNAQKVARSV